MEIVTLKRKKIIPLQLEYEDENGDIKTKECECIFDDFTIDYFQRTHKKGFLKAFSNITKRKEFDMATMMELISSIVRDKKTGRILGSNFFRQFDSVALINALSPIMEELVKNNMPVAKNEKEKN